jgi:hypothetical protein
MTYVERLGLPAVFCCWLMWYVMRELKEIRALVNKQAVLLAVISRTLDVPSTPSIPPPSSEGE